MRKLDYREKKTGYTVLLKFFDLQLIDWLFMTAKFRRMLSTQAGLLSREGSLSCHTHCDMKPQFFRSHPKDCPIQLPLMTHMGCRGPILTWILIGPQLTCLAKLCNTKLHNYNTCIYLRIYSNASANYVHVYCR
jgi:hypothetical protein